MTIDVKAIEIFSRIDASRHDTITSLFSSQECPRGTTVLHYGEPADGLYVLEQGEVEEKDP
ncbi:MAG: cyclic nucleotide-binding domain-containing protein [Proteobacteria bacterium]|nr:cyclic nucleotide-binding domain-containing protein [Pseudomonadota bacterium]